MNNERTNNNIRKSVKQLVEQQLKILRFSNSKDLTLSIPKVDELTEDDIKSIVLEEMSDTHKIIFSQSFRCTSANDVILITLKML